MTSHKVTNMAEATLTILIMLALLLGVATSDFAADEKECKNQLISLSPCLGFISGESKSPSSQCCSILATKINSSRKCLCILVKDRDEPGLGVKINATLALSLPSLCNVPSTPSQCIGLLGLSPTSQEAQVFSQFANTTKPEGGAAISSGAGAETSTTARIRWYGGGKFEGLFLLWCMILMPLAAEPLT